MMAKQICRSIIQRVNRMSLISNAPMHPALRGRAGTRAGIWQESAAEVAKFDEEVVCSDANDEPS